jgi:predicted dinucleotide-binding enzyme
MTTAIIGTGGLGSVIARQLAAGGETLRLSSADSKSARTLALPVARRRPVLAGGWPVSGSEARSSSRD